MNIKNWYRRVLKFFPANQQANELPPPAERARLIAPLVPREGLFEIYDHQFQRTTGFGLFRTFEEAQGLIDSLLPSGQVGYSVRRVGG